MSHQTNILTSSRDQVDQAPVKPYLDRPAAGRRFEIVMTLLSAWLVGGLFLDGWAHGHVAQLETFFTPWHGVLYSGYLALAIFSGATLSYYGRQGYRWERAMPAGYELTLWGGVVFGLSGLGDMIWHLLFGIEKGIEAVASPTHLGLVLGLVLLVGGPFRAAWRRPETPSTWLGHLPSILSLSFILATLTFITQYAHPLVEPMAGRHYASSTWMGRGMGLISLMLQAGLLSGVVLLVVRRWVRLPAGLTFGLILGLTSLGLSFMNDTFYLLPGAIAAGIVADLLYQLLHPSIYRPGGLRLFAFAVPLTWAGLYFLNLMLVEGTWWSIHLVTGSIFMAGIVGWLLSYLILPPAIPGE